MKKLLKVLKNRNFILAVIICVLFTTLSFRLSYLTVGMGDYFAQMAQEKKKIELEVRGSRGSILDRNGIPLAVNRQIYVAQIDRQWMPAKHDDINNVLARTIQIIEENGDKLVDNLPLKYGQKVYTDNITPYLVDGFYYDFGTQDESSFKSRYNQWLERSGIKVDLPADEMFLHLKERFKIGDDLSDDIARKIISIRLDLYQTRFSQYEPVVIAEDINMKTITRLETLSDELQGIQVAVESGRYYPNGQSAQHIIGYVGKITDSNINEFERNNGLKITEAGYNVFKDKYGQTGVEAYAEKWLTGSLKERQGKLVAEVDASRRVIKVLEETPAMNGYDVVLTLDNRVQRAAENILAEELKKIREGLPPYVPKGTKELRAPNAHTGAIVILDVKTGEIIALASHANSNTPYDLNNFADGISTEELNLLMEEPSKPLIPAAYEARLAPGSTFKMLVGIAGLMENKITVNETIYDSHRFVSGNIKGPACWAFYSHGNVNLMDALKVSCNYYFSVVGNRVGIENILKWGENLGLHGPTGLEIMPRDSKGNLIDRNIVANPNDIPSSIDVYSWTYETMQASIGQSFTTVSPLAIARYVATIANGGKVYDTHIVKEIRTADGQLVKEFEPVYKDSGVKKEYIDAVKEGMWRVTNQIGGAGGNGTAAYDFQRLDPSITVAGKTGTAQIDMKDSLKNTSWFAGFAPYDDPEIAIVVMIPNGKESSNANFVTIRMLEEYYRIMNSDKENPLPEYSFTR